ncbi:LmeA family phospholipid-binding protein [Streptomyces sp. NPDC004749]
MRPPTRIPRQAPNPYDELARLAPPEYDHDVAEASRDRDPLDPAATPARAHDPAGTGPGIASDRDDDPADAWSPPDHRGRSRFGSLSLAVKLTLTLVVGAAFLLLADRAAEMYAREKAADKLQQSLGLATRPDVDIHGFPFLTQVAAKRLDRVDVTVPDVPAGRVSLDEVRATARDIRVEGSLPDSLQGAVVGRLDGDVLLSFDDLGRELGASQVKFTDAGPDTVQIAGSLPVAGHDLRLRAQAHIANEGGRSVATTVDGMRLDIPGVATYRPGKDRAHSGLRLAPETASAIARSKDQARAMLQVPSVVKALGVPEEQVRRALRGEDELARLTGRPGFVQQLMNVNLVDVVAANPQIMKQAGVDPALVDAVLNLRPPELSDRLSLSFELPRTPGDVRLRDIRVEREGIRAELVGSGLEIGGNGGNGENIGNG